MHLSEESKNAYHEKGDELARLIYTEKFSTPPGT